MVSYTVGWIRCSITHTQQGSGCDWRNLSHAVFHALNSHGLFQCWNTIEFKLEAAKKNVEAGKQHVKNASRTHMQGEAD